MHLSWALEPGGIPHSGFARPFFQLIKSPQYATSVCHRRLKAIGRFVGRPHRRLEYARPFKLACALPVDVYEQSTPRASRTEFRPSVIVAVRFLFIPEPKTLRPSRGCTAFFTCPFWGQRCGAVSDTTVAFSFALSRTH